MIQDKSAFCLINILDIELVFQFGLLFTWLYSNYALTMWFNLPFEMEQFTPQLGQVEPQNHFFLIGYISMTIHHGCILNISIDVRHREINVHVLILLKFNFHLPTGQKM